MQKVYGLQRCQKECVFPNDKWWRRSWFRIIEARRKIDEAKTCTINVGEHTHSASSEWAYMYEVKYLTYQFEMCCFFIHRTILSRDWLEHCCNKYLLHCWRIHVAYSRNATNNRYFMQIYCLTNSYIHWRNNNFND